MLKWWPHNTATIGLNLHPHKKSRHSIQTISTVLRINYFVITTSHPNQSIVVCNSHTAQSTLLIWKEDSRCSYLWGKQPYSHPSCQTPGWRFKCFFQIITLFALRQLLLLAECSLYRFIILELFFSASTLDHWPASGSDVSRIRFAGSACVHCGQKSNTASRGSP